MQGSSLPKCVIGAVIEWQTPVAKNAMLTFSYNPKILTMYSELLEY
jgi:hypothetical protein